jgi:flavin reductase (DIM6/NTAB) family NADH-FMN oxidoreductase RutF
LFRRLTHGVYVVGVSHGERRDAFTAAWVMQTSFAPPLLAVSVNPQNASHALVQAGRTFAVSVLARGDLELARRFGTRSGRDQDKLAGVAWTRGRHGAPILNAAVAFFDCELVSTLATGDHDIIVGRVIDGRVLDPAAAAMTYADTGEMDGSSALYPATL